LHFVWLAKRAVGSFEQTQIEKGLQVEWECYKKTIHHPDRLEGLAAFQEKRKHDYSNELKI
jgi:enoyl-CoA hydratase/carnithine racemase